MLPIHTILHPTDFSEYSNHAFEFACALARDYGCGLVVLHVVPLPDFTYGEGESVLPLDSERLIQEAREKLNHLEVPGANVRAERRLEQGDAVTEILRVAQELSADLIVMGTHGRTGLGRLLMGSVAEQVLRQASCPVLTVKTPQATPVVSPAMPEAVAI